MSSDSGVDSDSKTIGTTPKMDANNRFSKDKSFEECMDEFYDILISDDGSELFACKYEDCPNVEKQESDIIEHLRQHFGEITPNTIDINLSDQSTEKQIKKEVNSDVECDVECINISDDETLEIKSKDNLLDKHSASNSSDEKNGWEDFVAIGSERGKQSFYCTFGQNCDFKTNLRMKMKSHVSKHLESKVMPKNELLDDVLNGGTLNGSLTEGMSEFQYWHQCFNSETTVNSPDQPTANSTPKTRSASKQSSKRGPKLKSNSKSKAKTKKGSAVSPSPLTSYRNSLNEDLFESNSLLQTPNTSDLIDINFNHNNTILSLKGMASVKKLERFIQCDVIKGLKYFCCNFNGKCEFKSKRSQETANHVHCAHLGFYLECVRPNCDKIFRTPGSWREHQKNHICNFGLYGYQRGVTGVCRNSHLLKFQEKLIVEDDHKAYKCKWKGCGFVTRQRTACKRHIHNTHVCPYRRNKQWKKELLKYMELKSHMTNKPITDIKNERTFFCNRPQCGAELANETDLRRHENHFCKYKTVVRSAKNGQNGRNAPQLTKDKEKPKAVAQLVAQPYSSPIPSTSGLNGSRNESQSLSRSHSSEIKQKVRVNGHQIEERRDSSGTTNGQNLTLDPIKAKCEKFIKRELYDGIDYILCNAPNCKYTTKREDKIYEHIQKSHSLVSTRHNSISEGIPHLRKRSQSSLDSNETIISKKVSKSSTDNGHQSSQNRIQSTPQKPIQNSKQKIPQNSKQNSSQTSSKKTQKTSNGLQQKSIDSDLSNEFKEYYKVKHIDSEPYYFCDYPSTPSTPVQCRFYSPTKKELFDHIRQSHIFFRCDEPNCNREFKSKSLLEVHTRNHICGFGIAGRKATGVCSLENVRKYRREIILNGRYRYKCKMCEYTSEVKSAVLSHAHNRHIHPPPPPQ